MPNNVRKQNREESMINLEYHKGSFCIFSNVFCQEGYCSRCEIAKIHQGMSRQTIPEEKRVRILNPSEINPNLRDIPNSKAAFVNERKMATLK